MRLQLLWWRLGLASSEIFGNCWDGDYDFDECCHIRYDLAVHETRSTATLQRVVEILNGTRKLKGNTHCWWGYFDYRTCCSLNAELWNVPKYLHPFLLLATRWADLVLVQGAVLDAMQDDFALQWLPHSNTVPYQGVQRDGEGLLWSGGAVLALGLSSISLPFPVGPSRRFLELCAGTGAASLVALARGFTVLSTDLREESQWQRAASARASFGPQAPELRRLRHQSLDLLDESTWPQRSEGLFDLVAVSPSAHLAQELCLGIRRLLLRLLAPGGVALFSPNNFLHPAPWTGAYEPCLRSDEDLVVSTRIPYTHPGPWLFDDAKRDLRGEGPLERGLVYSLQLRTSSAP